MRMIKGNVERIAETKERADRLLADGFTEAPGVSDESQRTPEAAGQAYPGPGNRASAPEGRLETMGVQELRALAKKRGLRGCSGLSREQLVAVLKENG